MLLFIADPAEAAPTALAARERELGRRGIQMVRAGDPATRAPTTATTHFLRVRSALVALPRLTEAAGPTVVTWRRTDAALASSVELASLLAAVTCFHCASQSDRRHALALGAAPERLVFIPPAFATPPAAEAVADDAPGPLRLVNEDELEWESGHELALSAMKRAVLAGASLDYAIVARGHEATRVRYTIFDLELDGLARVVDPGDPAAASVRGRAQVMFSTRLDGRHSDGVLGGLPAGRAVVAARPAHEDLVRDGVDGLLAEPRDVASMGLHLVALHADPARRHALAASARSRAALEFGPDREIDAWGHLLRALAS